jgi:hypothetical protein
MHSGQTKRISWLLAAKIGTYFVILIFFFKQAEMIWTMPVEYDDAYNATIAKNIASGVGYASTYGEIEYFNPEITTGPGLIFPAAVLIKIFGNNSWVAHLTASLSTSILLIMLLWAFKIFRLSPMKCWLARLLAAVSFVVFAFSHGLNAWWSLIGEYPSSLLVALAILLSLGSRGNTLLLVLSGLSLGLAIQTKLLALIFTGPVFIAAFISICRQERYSETGRESTEVNSCSKIMLFAFARISKRALTAFMIISLAASAPTAAFETYKARSLGMDGYLQLKRSEKAFLDNRGSGLNDFNNSKRLIPTDSIKSNLKRNTSVITNEFGGIRYLSALIVVAALIVVTTISSSELSMFGYLLLLSAAINLSWWLLLSNVDFYRHSLIGMILLSIGLALLVSSQKTKRALSLVCIWMVALVLSAPPLKESLVKGHFFSISLRPDPRLRELEETAFFLTKHFPSEKEVQLLGCGWWANRDLEFVLREAGNFRSCDDPRLASISTRKAMVLVKNKRFWNWENNQRFSEIGEQAAVRPLFHSSSHVIGRVKLAKN